MAVEFNDRAALVMEAVDLLGEGHDWQDVGHRLINGRRGDYFYQDPETVHDEVMSIIIDAERELGWE